MSTESEHEVLMIPVQSVRITNPRVRDRHKFELIVRSISEQGLKRPITVTEAKIDEKGQLKYDLVCGQGRLEAFIALGQAEIPAFVRKMTKADGLIASLVENIARRRVRCIDQIRLIQWMHDQGNSLEEIARKTGLVEKYLQGVLKLLEQGEERVLDAVLHGRLPITIAVQIASTDDEGAQRMLHEAYERGAMKQVSLSSFRHLLEQRKCFGKSYKDAAKFRVPRKTTTDGLILAYKQETQRQKLMVKKARACETRLLSLIAAFKALYADENFTTLLRAEDLDTLPKFLMERVRQS
ncbi:MAG: plasmid partitioning protein RepB C-terminal domain-containing protein [Nibricoccus sp.]